MRLSKVIVAAPITLGVAIALLQFVRPAHLTNPDPHGPIPAPPPIRKLLERSCYDCHSNETAWPWYAKVAPASWLVARDVAFGRRQINFSRWDEYTPLARVRKLKWMNRALQEEQMPPWEYVLLHPGARLKPQERAALEQWVESQIAQPLPADSNTQVKK